LSYDNLIEKLDVKKLHK